MFLYQDNQIEKFIDKKAYNYYQPLVNCIDQAIKTKSMQGNDFLGWYDIQSLINNEEFKLIKDLSEKIRNNYDVLLVIGIGGSYLGAKCVIELLTPYFNKQTPEIIFVGQNMSSQYLDEVYKYVENKRFCINVISKSGTTLEPALAFRLFKNLLKLQDPQNYHQHIIATTDKAVGTLKTMVDNNNWTSLVIPDDVGGRFSVLTPVGLLPIAVSGIDIEMLVKGAYDAQMDFSNPDLNTNLAYRYAVNRNILYKQGKDIEILVGYEPKLYYLCEWWKQLMAESEGKDLQGIFPTGAIFTTDLHSIGQYIQQGKRNIFETVIKINHFDEKIVIDNEANDEDHLNYLAGKEISFCNDCALTATMDAHISGNVANTLISIDKLDAYHVGYLIYFFELSVAMSGYLFNINPFNQPGVEEYKTRMFNLLGRK